MIVVMRTMPRRLLARVRRLPTWALLLADAVFVVLTTSLAGLLLPLLTDGMNVAPFSILVLLELAASGIAAAVGLLCAYLAHTSADARMKALATACAFYCVAVVPLSLMSVAVGPVVQIRAGSVVASLVLLTLLALALTPLRRRRLSEPRVLVIGLLVTAVIMAATGWVPASVVGVLVTDIPDSLIVTGWVVVAAGFTLRGFLERSSVWWRLGFAFGVLAATRLTSSGLVDSVGPEFLRVTGLALMLAAVGMHGLALSRQVQDSRDAEAETAAAAAQAQAERDHEMRNVLTNLAATRYWLSTNHREPGAEDDRELAELIRQEFERLRALLDPVAAEPQQSCVVDSVLTRMVTLSKAAGKEITMDCPTGLVVSVPPATVAQVVTNLLANCARHAPGAPVHIRARRVRSNCRIDVIDSGPGIPLVPGSGPTTGSGLGLSLSSQLLDDHGGSLSLLPSSRRGTGCTARLELPLVHAARHLASVPDQVAS
jgi:two-component system OmpR family sensor kinase